VTVLAILAAALALAGCSTSGGDSGNGSGNQSASCSPDYDPCVPDASYDLDCADIGQEVEVVGDDVYGLDADGDGYGCESYG
jgi:hypothetical protein